MHAEIENPVDIGAVAALEHLVVDNPLLQLTGDAIVQDGVFIPPKIIKFKDPETRKQFAKRGLAIWRRIKDDLLGEFPETYHVAINELHGAWSAAQSPGEAERQLYESHGPAPLFVAKLSLGHPNTSWHRGKF